MGVTGLLPLLKKSADQVNVSQLEGKTVAIDAYVWLHRGAFSCADRLARGEKTLGFVGYGQKMLNMLLAHKIKPILVFDGRRLEAKADTEKKRHEIRKQNKQKAEELLKAGREPEARDFLRRSVDVNHSMAIELIRVARKMNVDCIVAPHEADAQLAFLNRQGLAQVVITEDSDLILFGCSQILYKLDVNGNGLMVRADKLHLTLGRPHESPEQLLTKLRQMCILSGCDYVGSLPGVGLVKAKKFVMATSDPDFLNAIKRLPGYLNLKTKVDEEYIRKVAHADLTFRKQLVFDPKKRQLVTIDGQEVGDEPFSGTLMDPDVAFELALGNIDPFTMQKVANFDLNNVPLTSIWSENFTAPDLRYDGPVNAFVTAKKEVSIKTTSVVRKPMPVKPRIEPRSSTWMLDLEMTALYATKSESKLKSEVKCLVNEEGEVKERVCSSYFSSKQVKTPQLQIEEADEVTSLLGQIDKSPVKSGSTQHTSILMNPFARKSNLPASPVLNRYALESVRLTKPDPEEDKPEEEIIKPSLSRFKFRRPLFSKTGQQVEKSPDKSPVITYKRKRNENFSPTKRKAISKYFCDKNAILDMLDEPETKNGDTFNSIERDLVPLNKSNVKRGSVGPTPGLKKTPKGGNGQFSLLTFGFSRKTN
ncbi:exonuclease 1 [Neocloeon triangulifer]|uniref:exonuclease 1 n=1 Tax=Neocloeon triangulifer TaxID=2078957 RepID=UPI00286F2503|nr:exonuclease 1 [Neocloeon triangulifer]